MSETSIEWTDFTFNPWIGCTKVSAGCLNCYAETQDKFRSWTPEGWGKGKPRKRTSKALWKGPLKWNRDAERRRVMELHSVPAGQIHQWQRPRVFCASLADWLDDEVPVEWLADLLQLIRETPALDWQLLTKRPENLQARLVAAAKTMDLYSTGYDMIRMWLGGRAPANVWIGTSVEDQTRADERIPKLLKIPAAVRFLSCEPLLGPTALGMVNLGLGQAPSEPRIHWVIAGGESGPKARPMHPDWARDLRDQCQAAGVAFLFKQWGEFSYDLENPIPTKVPGAFCYDLKRIGKKAAGRILDGRTWDEFPNDLAEARRAETGTRQGG